MPEKPALKIDFESEGVVKSFTSTDEDRYAFVTSTDGSVTDDIYVDRKCMKKSKIESLAEGARVKCSGIHGDRGPKAKRIRLL